MHTYHIWNHVWVPLQPAPSNHTQILSDYVSSYSSTNQLSNRCHLLGNHNTTPWSLTLETQISPTEKPNKTGPHLSRFSCHLQDHWSPAVPLGQTLEGPCLSPVEKEQNWEICVVHNSNLVCFGVWNRYEAVSGIPGKMHLQWSNDMSFISSNAFQCQLSYKRISSNTKTWRWVQQEKQQQTKKDSPWTSGFSLFLDLEWRQIKGDLMILLVSWCFSGLQQIEKTLVLSRLHNFLAVLFVFQGLGFQPGFFTPTFQEWFHFGFFIENELK